MRRKSALGSTCLCYGILVLLFAGIVITTENCCWATIYVDQAAAPGGDGSSWPSAYRSIQDGIDAAGISGDAVWVAEGTYLENIVLMDGTCVYGGFAKSEMSPAERNLTVHRSTIDASTADSGNAAQHVVVMDSIENACLDGFVVRGGIAGVSGGGLFAQYLNETCHVSNCIFQDNAATYGGGIYLYFSKIEIANCEIKDNTAMGSYYGGGGVFIENGTSSLRCCLISNNMSAFNGGGIYTSVGSPIIIDCTLSNNIADNHGGGGYLDSDNFWNTRLQLIRCLVTDNQSTQGSGGGIYSYIGDHYFQDCDFRNNQSGNNGGGFRCTLSTTDQIEIEGCLFNNNQTVNDGGGAYFSGDIEITDCTVTGNTAGNDGGGIYDHYGNDMVFTRCYIVGNHAGGDGGGLWDESGEFVFSNSQIIDNTADGVGGGMFCDSDGSIDASIISSNSALGQGGGMYCDGFGEPDVTNSILTGNTSGDHGGAIYANDNHISLANCLVGWNTTAGYGGAVFLVTNLTPINSLTLSNTIIEGNNGHAFHESDESRTDPNIFNCLFHDNPDGDYYDRDTTLVYTGAANLNGSLPRAFDNVDGDPLYEASITGSWTQAPIFDPQTYRTTLVDGSAGFVPGALVGRLVNPKTLQNKVWFIIENSSDTIEVIGDVSGTAQSGGNYEIQDYHVQLNSPCIDSGTRIRGVSFSLVDDIRGPAYPLDYAGDPRPVDTEGYGNDVFPPCYDIGIYECQERLTSEPTVPRDFPRILVASEENNTIQIYSPAGVFIDSLISPGSIGLDTPGGFVIGGNNTLYVISKATERILRFDAETGAYLGIFIDCWDNGLSEPRDIVYGPDGNLYVSCYDENKVIVYDGQTGEFIRSKRLPFQFYPTGMTFGPDGSLYICGHTDDSVRRWDLSDNPTTEFVESDSGGLNDPEDLVFGPDGNLYVSGFGMDTVYRYDGQTGEFIDSFVPFRSGGLNDPTGLTFGPDGNLYVVSQATNQVLQFNGQSGAFMGVYLDSANLASPGSLIFASQYVTGLSDWDHYR